MSVRVRDLLMRSLGELRHEPSGKRIRATFGEQTVIDSISAVLVWEPRRVVPSYAVPAADVQGELVPLPQTVSAEPVGVHLPDLSRLPILNPRVPFEVHTTMVSRSACERRPEAAPPRRSGRPILIWRATSS